MIIIVPRGNGYPAAGQQDRHRTGEVIIGQRGPDRFGFGKEHIAQGGEREGGQTGVQGGGEAQVREQTVRFLPDGQQFISQRAAAHFQ